MLRALAEAALDVAALLCFIVAHLSPIRVFVMYRDLFVSVVRRRRLEALTQLRGFIRLYRAMNNGKGGGNGMGGGANLLSRVWEGFCGDDAGGHGSYSSNRRHMRLVEGYEMHLNTVHKRCITLTGATYAATQAAPMRPRRLGGGRRGGHTFETAAGRYDPTATRGESLYSVLALEKRSVGTALSVFLHEARAAVRLAEGGYSNSSSSSSATSLIPPEAAALCCVLANNVLAVCGVVGDAFFRDMALLVYADERAGAASAMAAAAEAARPLHEGDGDDGAASSPQQQPSRLYGTIPDGGSDYGGSDDGDGVASRGELYAAGPPLSPEAIHAMLLPHHPEHRRHVVTAAPTGGLGTEYIEQAAGHTVVVGDPSNATAKSALEQRYLRLSARTSARFGELSAGAIAADQLGLPPSVASFAIDSRLAEVLEKAGVGEGLGDLPNWHDGTTQRVGYFGRNTNRWGAPARNVSTPTDDEAAAAAAAKRSAYEASLEAFASSGPVPLPLPALAAELAASQDATLGALESALSTYETDAHAIGLTALNYDYEEGRLRCIYHALMVPADYATLFATLLLCAPLYRIPTLLKYAAYQRRHGSAWRWALLMTLGEYLLDIIFVVLYAVCILSIVEIVYVHERMLHHWRRDPSSWSLREGIIDALGDLCDSFGRAIKSLMRCRSIYYLLLTCVLAIVAPIELATNHFGLARARWLCFRGWMIAFVGWVVLVVAPFVIVFSPNVFGTLGSAAAPGEGSATDRVEPAAGPFSTLLYGYAAFVFAILVLVLAVMLIRSRREQRQQIAVSLAFLPLTGATVGSFAVTVLEVAQLTALPIIVATGARALSGGVEGFVFSDGSGGSLDFSWLSDAAHYLFLDQTTRFGAYSDATAADGNVTNSSDTTNGGNIVAESTPYAIGYYASLALALFAVLVTALPVVVDSLLGKRTGMTRHPLWRGAAFIGTVAALFVARNVSTWADCSMHRTFDHVFFYDGDDDVAPSPHNATPAPTNDWHANNATAVFFAMQGGEPSRDFACWYQRGMRPSLWENGTYALPSTSSSNDASASGRAGGALSLLALGFFAVMVVLRGVRFAQQSGGDADDSEDGPSLELSAVFHSIADTYATVLHISLSCLSAFLYARPLAFCCLHAALLLCFALLHLRNAPLVPRLLPVNRIATLWELNAFRNIGYCAAAGTAIVCAATLQSVSNGGDALSGSKSSFVASDAVPIALIAMWGAAAVLSAALFVVSLKCPSLLRICGGGGGAADGGEGDDVTQWEALQQEAIALVRELAAEGRLVSTYASLSDDNNVPLDGEPSTALCCCSHSSSSYNNKSRLAALEGRFANASSLSAFADACVALEGAVHIASYTPAFFASRREWWASLIALGRLGVRPSTISMAEDALQSLRNGCARGHRDD